MPEPDWKGLEVNSYHRNRKGMSIFLTIVPIIVLLTSAMRSIHLNRVTQTRQNASRLRLTSLWLDSHGIYDPVTARGVTASAIGMALGMGADKDACDAYGNSPMVLAARTGNPEVVRALVGAGANASDRCPSGTTPLIAAASGTAGAVKVLLAAGANPNISDFRGRTALMTAAYRGNAMTVRLLLNAGANPNIRVKGGSTALTVAVSMKRANIVRALVHAGADITVKDQFGRSPLVTARRNGDASTVAALTAAAHGRHRLDSDIAQADVKGRAVVTAALPADG